MLQHLDAELLVGERRGAVGHGRGTGIPFSPRWARAAVVRGSAMPASALPPGALSRAAHKPSRAAIRPTRRMVRRRCSRAWWRRARRQRRSWPRGRLSEVADRRARRPAGGASDQVQVVEVYRLDAPSSRSALPASARSPFVGARCGTRAPWHECIGGARAGRGLAGAAAGRRRLPAAPGRRGRRAGRAIQPSGGGGRWMPTAARASFMGELEARLLSSVAAGPCCVASPRRAAEPVQGETGLRVGGHGEGTTLERGDVLRRVEGEGGGCPMRADRPALPARAIACAASSTTATRWRSRNATPSRRRGADREARCTGITARVRDVSSDAAWSRSMQAAPSRRAPAGRARDVGAGHRMSCSGTSTSSPVQFPTAGRRRARPCRTGSARAGRGDRPPAAWNASTFGAAGQPAAVDVQHSSISSSPMHGALRPSRDAAGRGSSDGHEHVRRARQNRKGCGATPSATLRSTWLFPTLTGIQRKSVAAGSPRPFSHQGRHSLLRKKALPEMHLGGRRARSDGRRRRDEHHRHARSRHDQAHPGADNIEGLGGDDTITGLGRRGRRRHGRLRRPSAETAVAPSHGSSPSPAVPAATKIFGGSGDDGLSGDKDRVSGPERRRSDPRRGGPG